MPESKRRKKHSQSSASKPGLPAETPDMSANDRKNENTQLTLRQQATLPVVAISPSIAQAARDTGVSERTLRRWLDDPAYREELSTLHGESYNLARQQLQALVPHCISVLAEEALANPDASVRIRSARYLLSFANKFQEAEKLAADLRDLRAALFHFRRTDQV